MPELAARALLDGGFARLEILHFGRERVVALPKPRVVARLPLHLRLQRGDFALAAVAEP